MNGMKIKRFQPGQVVISRKGKDVGKWYVVVGWDDMEQRVLICNGRNYKPGAPKKKNPVHLQRVSRILYEVPESLLAGRLLNGERIRRLLSEIQTKKYQNKEVD